MRKNRKGNADVVTGAIVALGIGVIVIAVIAIMLGAFRDDLVNNVAYCGRNSSGGTSGTILYTGCPIDYNVTTRGLTFLDNATSKFGTAGTIVGVLFLLAIIGGGGALGVYAYRKIKG